ncbi:MAG: hypothetical protein NZ530_07865 [Thermodesulfobacteriaceae bacterium]|nr:hypothetical protein [Thermodesulfobacteriaceae bacterium]MDW8136708.1 hypothetical protein [Thermodesulfobacterium sp.]
MNRNTLQLILILILLFLSLDGLILHYRIHPFLISDNFNSKLFTFNFSFFIATCFSIIDVFLVTILFFFRKTVVYAYLLNGLLVIYGTILMIHFSIFSIGSKNLPLSLETIFLKSTFPHLLVSWADFLGGKLLYDLKIGKF